MDLLVPRICPNVRPTTTCLSAYRHVISQMIPLSSSLQCVHLRISVRKADGLEDKLKLKHAWLTRRPSNRCDPGHDFDDKITNARYEMGFFQCTTVIRIICLVERVVSCRLLKSRSRRGSTAVQSRYGRTTTSSVPIVEIPTSLHTTDRALDCMSID
jgi:hypothetical protein